LGAPKVGPWDGFSSPKRFNPAVKQVHGEAEPVHPGRARLLLKTGRAVVFKRFPFTLLLKYPGEHNLDEPFRLKIDPGSRTTGLALIGETSGEVVWAGELAHQGEEIVERLRKRQAARGAQGAQAAAYTLPTSTLQEPAQIERLATAVPEKPRAERGDLGRAAAQTVSHHGTLDGAGAL